MLFRSISEQDSEQGTDSHRKRIIEIADNTDRRDVGQSGSDQHLCPIGYDALYQTGECIQDTGCFSPVEMESLCNILCNRPCGDDGNRIVGSA